VLTVQARAHEELSDSAQIHVALGRMEFVTQEVMSGIADLLALDEETGLLHPYARIILAAARDVLKGEDFAASLTLNNQPF
jgi:hypothetical protein